MEKLKPDSKSAWAVPMTWHSRLCGHMNGLKWQNFDSKISQSNGKAHRTNQWN